MKTATSPDHAAATRGRTPRAAADKPTKPTKAAKPTKAGKAPKAATRRTRAAEATPARRARPVPTAELEEPIEGEAALGDLDEEALDPDALEEVAHLETAAADEPSAVEGEDPTDDAAAAEAGAAEDDEEDVEPDLGALLTGMLAEEPDPDVEVDEDADVSSLEVEYVPTARGNEFVCSACFLIWNRRHLADADRKVCRDCIDDVGPAAPRVAAA